MFEKKVPIPFDEQETVVTMDYERDLAFVYSSRYTMVAKLEQLVEEYISDFFRLVLTVWKRMKTRLTTANP